MSLDSHQQELVAIVKVAHRTLAVARKTKAAEQARRVSELKLRLDREFDEGVEQIKLDLDGEVAAHESALDEAIIAAYNGDVPTRQVALEGFGNRYDGAVTRLLAELRVDGRVGYRQNFQDRQEDAERPVEFPKAVDVDAMISESTTVSAPTFTAEPESIVLVEPLDDQEGIYADAVKVTMDDRDPYFRVMGLEARPGTPFLHATSTVIYMHPATGKLVSVDSRETSDLYWDHRVARWVKDNPDAALAGFNAATNA